MNADDHNVVRGHTVRGQPRGQVIHGTKRSGHGCRPLLHADAHGLGDADPVFGLQFAQERAPKLLLTELIAKLKDQGVFTDVTAVDEGGPAPAGALLLEGKFTLIDPGSRAKE